MSRLAALALAAVLLSGCEAHFSLGSSSPELAKAKLEAGLKDAITEKTGVTLTSVSCDGPLKGEKGATQRCAVIDGEGKTIGVAVTATGVEGTRSPSTGRSTTNRPAPAHKGPRKRRAPGHRLGAGARRIAMRITRYDVLRGAESVHVQTRRARPRFRTARRQPVRVRGTAPAPGRPGTSPWPSSHAVRGRGRVHRRDGRTPTNRLLGKHPSSANPKYLRWAQAIAVAAACG